MKRPGSALLLVLLLGTACQAPLASGGRSPAVAAIARAEAPNPVVIRVLTYNIRHGEGRDRVRDLMRTAEVMKGTRPDIVALQEVDRGTERSGGVDQLAELGSLMGMHGRFGKAIDHEGGEYGVAVLSRWPIEGEDNHHLPSAAGTEQRTALTVRVRVGDNGPVIRFTSTHLSQNWEPENTLAQARRLNELLATDGASGVLAGDLNAGTDSDAIRVLEVEWTVASSAATLSPPPPPPSTTTGQRQGGPGPGRRGGPRSDYVLVRPAGHWRVLESTVIEDNGASDHRPVLSVLEWVGAR